MNAPAPTPVANMCYCGAPLKYEGARVQVLQCPHCDRVCTVQKDTNEPCPRCLTGNEHIKNLMRD